MEGSDAIDIQVGSAVTFVDAEIEGIRVHEVITGFLSVIIERRQGLGNSNTNNWRCLH